MLRESRMMEWLLTKRLRIVRVRVSNRNKNQTVVEPYLNAQDKSSDLWDGNEPLLSSILIVRNADGCDAVVTVIISNVDGQERWWQDGCLTNADNGEHVVKTWTCWMEWWDDGWVDCWDDGWYIVNQVLQIPLIYQLIQNFSTLDDVETTMN
jgi:hypothetical protein